MSTTKLKIRKIEHSLMGEKDIQRIFLLLNDLAKLVSGDTKCSTQNKMKTRNGLSTVRYSPYEKSDVKSKRRKKSCKVAGKKIKMKLSDTKTTQSSPFRPTYSNFLFLDDMLTMPTKEVCEIARKEHGYIMKLLSSQDSLKLDESIGERSRLAVSKAPGTYWIKYS